MAALTPRERMLKALELGDLMQFVVDHYALKLRR